MFTRAPRNRTLNCTQSELESFSRTLVQLTRPVSADELTNRIINQELEAALPFLPKCFVDLLILDPPYNLTKNYNGHVFRSRETEEYAAWFERILVQLLSTLKVNASLYVCSDWKTSNIVFPVLDRHLLVRNRITWEREKGRGAKTNWKNNTEDIWFCTVGERYCFNVEAVKLKRRVIAPYRCEDGKPKDWEESQNGNYRLTYPSNIWGDITIPFCVLVQREKDKRLCRVAPCPTLGIRFS